MASATLQVLQPRQQFFFIYFLKHWIYAILIFYLSEDLYYTFDPTGIPCLQLSASMPLPALRWLLPW